MPEQASDRALAWRRVPGWLRRLTELGALTEHPAVAGVIGRAKFS
jgi:hypothetical protein